MKKLARILILIMAAMLLFTACVKQEPSADAEENIPTPAPASEAAPEPTPEPIVFDETEAEARLNELIAEELTIDISAAEGFPENMFAEDREEAWNIFGTKQEERAWLAGLPRTVIEQVGKAEKAALERFDAEYPDFAEFSSVTLVQKPHPEWQLLYTLIKGSENIEQANYVIAKSIGASVEITGEATDEYRREIRFEWLPYRDAIAQLGMDEAGTMGCCFSYSYCITVYNELAEEIEYIQPEPKGNLLAGITWPMESHTRLRKTWYADRDGGARKHTGTDIWAAADTELYSCTDGTVTFIGYSEGMGNAVVVTDEYGYEFHYYHMIRLTDFLKEGDTVKAGDLIGHVGNTGNSARDHLHLTIVAPDGVYVNPYPHLLEIEP